MLPVGSQPLHIPDGYLSPSTCAGLYAASAPFWYVALRRIKQTLHTRMVPLISVLSAFSFVIMMFNLPLPGGTTGHAVGMAIASIVLGPWASIIAISIALVIQALFFGDGGVTAIGANCFNMAVAGSLVAYGAYRVIGYRAPVGARRRVVAAGAAGYLAINVSALLAAIEFGIQPLFFRDAAGAPLYAPYPLAIAIPAMMIGHLTIAGLAELVISAGLIAWLQRADPALLCRTAPDAPDFNNPAAPPTGHGFLPTAQALWITVAVLVVLTPIGIQVAGTAWGEWTAQDFADPQASKQIAATSGNHAAPARPPSGLERLSSLWSAPIARYEPGFLRNASEGYLFSAVLGVGSIAAIALLTGLLLRRRERRAGLRRKTFIEKTAAALAGAVRDALFAEQIAENRGFLQGVDPRVKVAGIGSLIVAAVAVHRLWVLAGILAIAIVLARFSQVPLRILITRVWLSVLAFTGVIAAPAAFLINARSAAFLILRAETTATLSILLILTTRWPHLLKALRSFRVPATVVAMLGMTYRYIFLLLQTAYDISESREARQVGVLPPADRRRLAAGSVGVLLGKSIAMSGDVHLAMQARGFRGEVHILEQWKMRASDWLPLAGMTGLACVAVWVGR
jgi:cobalt/nickel transport system permease protein